MEPNKKSKKSRKPYKKPWPSTTSFPSLPPLPSFNKPGLGMGMRMNPVPVPVPQMGMRMEQTYGGYQHQVQVMKLSPRLRDKPLSQEQRETLFHFTGESIEQ